MQGQGQPDGAFELPTISKAVHAGGDDRSPIAGLSGFQPALTGRFGPLGGRAPSAPLWIRPWWYCIVVLVLGYS